MSYFYNAVNFCCFVLLAQIALAEPHPLIELRTKSRILKGEPAIFKAKILQPGIKEIRLRYKSAAEEEYRWVDFQPQSENELRAIIDPNLISGSVVSYYVVWLKNDGEVEVVHGSPSQPLLFNIDHRRDSAIVHQNSSYRKSKTRPMSFADRYGDDDIEDQIALFRANDKDSRHDRFERWAKPGAKMSEERIEHLGARDLIDVLRMFPKLDFALGEDRYLKPVFSGLPAQARLKLKIDDIELYDEFDGSSQWAIDSLRLAGVAIRDTAAHLLGESGGLLGEVNVIAPRMSGMMTQLRAGWPQDLSIGVAAGKGIGRFENYWVGSLRHDPRGLTGLSLFKGEYWWDKEKRPFATMQLQFFANSAEEQKAYRYVWNSALGFEFPFTQRINTRFSLFAGQTFYSAGQSSSSAYRLFRTGLQVKNDFHLSASHLVQVEARTSLVGISSEPFYYESGIAEGERLVFELRSCDVLGLRTTLASNCRLSGAVSLRDRYQMASWTALSSGLEIVAANREKNDLASLMHPSLFLEISPSETMDLAVGFSSSLRWPTLMEKDSYVADPGDSQKMRDTSELLGTEKLKQVSAGLRWQALLDYAHFNLDAQVRAGWLDDLIVLNPRTANNRAWSNRGGLRYSGVNFGLAAKLASANQIYLGTELHQVFWSRESIEADEGCSPLGGSNIGNACIESIVFPKLKMVFGARLNLGTVGSLHVDVQALSLSGTTVPATRINVFYQSRTLLEHFILEGRIADLLSLNYGQQNDSLAGVYGNLKFFM